MGDVPCMARLKFNKNAIESDLRLAQRKSGYNCLLTRLQTVSFTQAMANEPANNIGTITKK